MDDANPEGGNGYLQTLANIAGGKTSAIVFPVPMDLIAPLPEALKKRAVRATMTQSAF